MSASDAIPQWIAFGDSITQFAWREGGYGADLQNQYQRKLDVVQRGYSGYNTDWALLLAPQILPKKGTAKRLKAISIFFGANDAVVEGGRQHVPLDRYKTNLKKLIDLIHHPSSEHYSPETDIVIIGISPVCLHQEQRTRERTATYAKASLEVVAELRAAGHKRLWHVETHDAMLAKAREIDPLDPEKALWLLLEDGLHLSGDGYRVVSARIWQTLRQEAPHLLPDALPRCAPDWSVIDPADPGKVLDNISCRNLPGSVAPGKK